MIPRKKTAIEEQSVVSSTEQKENAAVGKWKYYVYRLPYRICQRKRTALGSREVRSAYLRILNKFGSRRHQSNWFAMNRKNLALSKKPKEGKPAIKMASAKREIDAFFDDASTPLPDKKHVSKVTGKHREL